jgi:signal transduction histidine kinase
VTISRKVQLYIGVITTAAMFFVVIGSVDAQLWDWQNLTIWALVCVLSELLWLPTISNQATVSMASTFNLAVIYLLGWERSVWVIAASTLFANLAIQKKEWYKAIFNVGQSVLTGAVAGMVFRLSGGAVLLPEAAGSGAEQIASFLSRFNNVELIVPFLASGFVYHIMNTFLVAGVIALNAREPVIATWRQNYGYMTEIVSSIALMFLAPLVVLSYGAVSFTGIILFFVPLIFIRDASQRYIQLQKAQDTLIRSERMVAKGEMAAEIGHELNNYLVAISGRAQMILMYVQPDADPRLRKAAEIIYENTQNMANLTAGLMGAAHKETQKRPSELNELIMKTVEFVRPQNKYDDVRFILDLDQAIPSSDLDPGQVQQVLINLFSNAADALHDVSRNDRTIRVTTHFEPQKNMIVMIVSDNGPGMTPEVASRIFEPTFTTKEKGHGFGLSTSYRIVENHSGKITVDTEPGRGATFTIQLPLHDVRGKSRGASAA